MIGLSLGLGLSGARPLAEAGEAAPVVTAPGAVAATNLGNPDGEVYSISGFAYDGEGDLSYQWLRNDVEIEGEDGATYTSVKATDSATTLKCTVTVTNGAGSDSGTTPGQLLSWAPQTWVENSGTAAMSRDGAFGSNSTFFEALLYLRAPATNSTRNYVRTRDNRVAIFTATTNGNGTVRVTLQDTSGTNLVDWTSTDLVSNSDDFLLHVAASLTGTPSMVVSVATVTNNLVGTPATLAGSFGSGPTNGTIDHARTGSGADQFLLSSTAVTNLANAEIGFIYIGHAAPSALADFIATGGVLKDPATVGSPVGLFYGPAETFTTNHGSGGDFTVSAGSFSDT